MRKFLMVVTVLVLIYGTGAGWAKGNGEAEICLPCVHADMDFLASDELHGRGSGTRDEHLAASFAASLFESFGLEPAGDNGGYIQHAPLPSPLPERLAEHLKAQGLDKNQRTDTWNAVAVLKGSDPTLAKEVILLTAHLDHLGIGNPVNGDSIFNGADDDASGTTAVIELARTLSGMAKDGKRPKRTIVFALFGSEELGGYGNHYFLEHPPVALTQIVANLEFEMIGRPDPLLPNRTLWLTGYERSNLGPELAKHGAAISADPHPKEHFFQRSDNYALAEKGIVAHTVSSFGLHADYHHPSDDLAKIDFAFMTHSIESMVGPVRWLAATNWRPSWVAGGKPSEKN
jgi:Peptidase family M28